MSPERPPDKRRRAPGENLPNADIAGAVIALLHDAPFFAYVIQELRREYTDESRTLAVEARGREIYIRVNPYYWNWAGEGVINEQGNLVHGRLAQMDLLRHEVGHVIHEHLFRRDDRDPELWNYAADAVVNQELENLPRGAIYPHTIGCKPGQTAEYYYKQLIQQQQQQQQQQQGQSGNNQQGDDDSQGGGGQGDGDDDQDGDDDGQGSGSSDEDDGSEDGQQGGNSDGGKGLPNNWMCDGSQWGTQNIKDSDPSYVQGEMKRIIEDALNRAVAEGHGDVSGDFIKKIQDALHKAQPWKRIFKQFIHAATKIYRTPTRSRPNRRTGLLSPGRRIIHELRICVAYDTSGSILDNQLDQFVSEIDAMAEIAEVHAIEFDSVIHNVYEWKRGHVVEVKGRGGTDFRPPFELATNEIQPDVMIVLTDGDGPLPNKKPKFPVLWCYTQIHKKAPWGTQVVLEI